MFNSDSKARDIQVSVHLYVLIWTFWLTHISYLGQTFRILEDVPSKQ